MQEIIVTTLKKFYKSMLIGRADTSKMLAPARGLYQETEGYKDLVKNPVEGFADFKNDMDKIKIRYYEK